MTIKKITVTESELKAGDIFKVTVSSYSYSKTEFNEVIENNGADILVRRIKIVNGIPKKTRCKPYSGVNHAGNTVIWRTTSGDVEA